MFEEEKIEKLVVPPRGALQPKIPSTPHCGMCCRWMATRSADKQRRAYASCSIAGFTVQWLDVRNWRERWRHGCEGRGDVRLMRGKRVAVKKNKREGENGERWGSDRMGLLTV